MTDEKLMKDEYNILPCPFCGGGVYVYEDYTGHWLVQCDSCGASIFKTNSRRSAILNWNRRIGREKNDDKE